MHGMPLGRMSVNRSKSGTMTVLIPTMGSDLLLRSKWLSVAGAVQASPIGAKIVSHGRYVAFQMAEVAIPKNHFADILPMIAELQPPPDLAPA